MSPEARGQEQGSNFIPEMEKNKLAVCLVSGGLDSAVAAGVAKSKGYDLYFMFANYGQKTLQKETECVNNLAEFYDPKEVRTVDLTWLREFGGSALFDTETKLDETNFLLEYVPFRNTVLLAAATAWAEVIGADSVFIGSSGGDHICPDNSAEFLDAFQEVMAQGTLIKKDIKLEAPLRDTDKTGAVKIGAELNIPFELTWSCHNNVDAACGHCSNCLSRLEAFKETEKTDPIPYEKSI